MPSRAQRRTECAWKEVPGLWAAIRNWRVASARRYGAFASSQLSVAGVEPGGLQFTGFLPDATSRRVHRFGLALLQHQAGSRLSPMQHLRRLVHFASDAVSAILLLRRGARLGEERCLPEANGTTMTNALGFPKPRNCTQRMVNDRRKRPGLVILPRCQTSSCRDSTSLSAVSVQRRQAEHQALSDGDNPKQ